MNQEIKENNTPPVNNNSNLNSLSIGTINIDNTDYNPSPLFDGFDTELPKTNEVPKEVPSEVSNVPSEVPNVLNEAPSEIPNVLNEVPDQVPNEVPNQQ